MLIDKDFILTGMAIVAFVICIFTVGNCEKESALSRHQRDLSIKQAAIENKCDVINGDIINCK